MRLQINILDSRMFSNLSLVLEIEGLVSGILSLNIALEKSGFHLDSQSKLKNNELAEKNVLDSVIGTIQLTFATGDGSLVIPVPSVPG